MPAVAVRRSGCAHVSISAACWSRRGAVRDAGSRFWAAPLSRHVAYLKREGVTRDGKDAELFGSGDGRVDGAGFAERCAGDRHHFRFMVSPEDAGELADMRTFARELAATGEAIAARIGRLWAVFPMSIAAAFLFATLGLYPKADDAASREA